MRAKRDQVVVAIKWRLNLKNFQQGFPRHTSFRQSGTAYNNSEIARNGNVVHVSHR
jgi:hypothetical protein